MSEGLGTYTTGRMDVSNAADIHERLRSGIPIFTDEASLVHDELGS